MILKSTFQLLIPIFVFFLFEVNCNLVKCNDWSTQDYTLIFENSFNTWTVGWNVLDNIKSSESIGYISFLDGEIKNYENFSFELTKNDNKIDEELSFCSIDSDEIINVEMFEIEEEDYSLENIID